MLAPWKESYDKDTALPTQVHTVKDMVFPVVMYGYQSWTIQKVEHLRIAAFELWCWTLLIGTTPTNDRDDVSLIVVKLI